MSIRADDAAVRNDTPPTWETSSALDTVRGIPGWAAVLVTLALTGLGILIDLQGIDKLGIIFQGCYFVGCLLAVLWVQRRGLFGPMVQPPLVLAFAVPAVVLATGGGSGGGLTARALAVGTPLINGFPTMAITTGATVLVGVIRILRQRAPEPARTKPGSAPARRQGQAPSVGQRQRQRGHDRRG